MFIFHSKNLKIKQEVNSEMCQCGSSAVLWEFSRTLGGSPNWYKLPGKQIDRIYQEP